MTNFDLNAYLDERLRQANAQYDVDQADVKQKEKEQEELKRSAPTNIAEVPFQKLQEGGNRLLTNTLKGVNAVGQFLPGVFNYLENNKAAYDKLYSVDSKTSEVKFNWGESAKMAGDALNAGFQHSVQIAQSKDLDTMMKNNYTGVDILQNLPGASGEYWKQASKTKSGGLATGVIGFGIEVLLDPTSLVAGGAYKGGSKLAEMAGAAGKLDNRAADIAGRVAANVATGNWLGGAVAMTARESSYFGRKKLLELSNTYKGAGWEGRLIDSTLTNFFGPYQIASDDTAVAMRQYQSYIEELPRRMNQLGEQALTAIVDKSEPTQKAIMAEMNKLVLATNKDSENVILDRLEKLGMKRDVASSLAQRQIAENARFIDMLQSASEHVPQLGTVVSKLKKEHVRRSFRLFADPDIQEDWLDYQFKLNTPGHIRLKASTFRDNLLRGLRISKNNPVLDRSQLNKKYNFDGEDELALRAFSKVSDPKRIESIRQIYERADQSVDKIAKTMFKMEEGTKKIADLDTTLMELDNLKQGLIQFATNTPVDVSRHINTLDLQMMEIQKSLGSKVHPVNLRQVYRNLTDIYNDLSTTPGMDPLYRDELKYVTDSFAKKVMTPKMLKLQSYIDGIDKQIEKGTSMTLDTLVAKRDAALARLDNEMAAVDIQSQPINQASLTKFGESRQTTQTNVVFDSIDALDNSRQELLTLATHIANDPNMPQLTHLETVINKLGSETLQAFQQNLGSKRNQGALQTELQNISTEMSILRREAEATGDAQIMQTLDSVENTLNGIKNNVVGPLNQVKQGMDGFDTAVDSKMVKALKKSGVILKPNAVEARMRLDLADDLHEFIRNNDEAMLQNSIVKFTPGDDGTWVAERNEKITSARSLTLQHLSEFVGDWGKARNLSDSQIAELNAAVSNSLVYVPGSREFTFMFKTKDQSLMQLPESMAASWRQQFGSANMDLTAIDPRTLEEEWHGLYGLIDDFAVNATEQGLELGKIVSGAKLVSGLRKSGMLVTEAELRQNPESIALKGWVNAGSIVKGKLAEEFKEPLYIRHTDALALKAMDRAIDDDNKFGFLATLSNTFRSAAMKYSPDSHVTQFLGNISMLHMMGMQDMFGKNVDLVGGMHKAYKSVVLADDDFQDAFEAGVAITQSILNQQQKANFLRTAPTLKLNTEDRQAGMKTIFESMTQLLTPSGRTQLARQTNNLGAELISGVTNHSYLDAQRISSTHTNFGSLLQLSDQMTRLFAYNSAMARNVDDFIKVNPQLARFRIPNTHRIDWQAFEKQAQDLGVQWAYDPKQIKELKESYEILRMEAAKLSNDVALNYNDTPNIVNFASKTGIVPFIKFQWKATGRIMELVDERPWSFAPYYTAQRNLNDGLNSDPENFDKQRQALPAHVRNSLVIPTGGKDSMGRQEFIDLSRWIPFGMFATGDQTADDDGGLSQQPNSLVSAPILELIGNVVQGKPGQGQSYGAWFVQQLASTFLPPTLAPGGRKIESLANAIDSSTFFVDQEGNVHERSPNAAEKLIMGYADIPEYVGNTLHDLAPGENLDEAKPLKKDINAMGQQYDPADLRPRTTVEQATGRFLVPGIGLSADAQKTSNEISKRYEFRMKDLTEKRNNYIRRIENGESIELQANIDSIDAQIAALETQRQKVVERFILGE